MELTPKQIGAYRVETMIGQGRNTLVLRAIDTIYQRPVALIVLSPYSNRADGISSDALSGSPNLALVRDFVSRGREAARLRHPHIAQVYEAGQADGYPYIAMELASQGSLADRLANHTAALPVADALDILAPIAEALAYAHAQGFLHGHLNPQNILLAEDNRVLVTNFQSKDVLTTDYVRDLTESARNQQLAYLAPEQARGQTDIDAQCDQFALGVLAYRLLTGRLPFAGNNPLALLRAIIEETPASPREFNAELPASVVSAVMQALDKNPARRFSHAAHFARALRGQPLSPSEAEDLAGELRGEKQNIADQDANASMANVAAGVNAPFIAASAPENSPQSTMGKSVVLPPIAKQDASTSLGKQLKERWGASSERRILFGAGALITVALIALLLATLVRYVSGGFTQPGVVEIQPKQVATTAPRPAATSTLRTAQLAATATDVEVVEEEPQALVDLAKLARYEDPAQRFRIDMPVGWSVIQRGTITQFNAADQATAQLFVEPLTAYGEVDAQAVMEQYLNDKVLVNNAAWQNVRFISEAQLQIDNQSAYEQRFDATFLGAPVRFSLIALRQEGATFMLGSSIALAESEKLAPLADAILHSFEFGDTSALKVAQLPTESPTPLPTPTLAPSPTNTQTPPPSPTPTFSPTPIPTATPTAVPPIAETPILLALAGEGTGLGIADEPQSGTQPLSGLSGRIAYAVWNPHSNRMDTYIYSLDSGVSWPHLPNMRQPDFRFDGELIVNAEGGELNNLTRLRVGADNEFMISEHPEDSRPHWSPSGKQVIFDSTFVGDRRSRIYLLADASVRQEVGPVMFEAWELFGRYPIFLADGRIAYSGCNVWENGGSCGIYTTAMQDLPPDGVTSSPGDIPTDNLGSQILFMSPREQVDEVDNWDVYLVNEDGSNLRRLTTDPGHDGLATASPDGNYVAFVSDRDGSWAVYAMRTDGSGQQKLFDLNANYGPGEQYWQYDWKQERLSWGW
ncbi:MAG: serine/threonine-protein kinase [Caldilineaceae bacterium]|nr:serine/threonine-protein kinase [Caldilineaceae bacterium]